MVRRKVRPVCNIWSIRLVCAASEDDQVSIEEYVGHLGEDTQKRDEAELGGQLQTGMKDEVDGIDTEHQKQCEWIPNVEDNKTEEDQEEGKDCLEEEMEDEA